MKNHAIDLQLATDWLRNTIASRLNVHFRHADSLEFDPFCLYSDDSSLARFVAVHNPTHEEFLVLILALMPHLVPGFLDGIIAKFLPEGGELPEFGGVKGANQRGIVPTGETAQFIIAGDDLERRLEVQRMLGNAHWLTRKRIVWVDTVPDGEPPMSGRLLLDPELAELLTVRTVSRPRFSTEFPAEHIVTETEWEDLVLHPATLSRIREIQNWIKHSDTLMLEWGMKKKLKAGYRALFHGPPGTGKTLTATLLGKYTGRDVFRVDLSRVVSKYIGETEKNLAALFHRAENKDWILFFDEADALFGRRTDIRDAHDKYANQETAYLLQRIENYDGLVILATNQRGNLDDAFIRRFQTIVHFPIPRPEERYSIWKKAFPKQIDISPDIDWQQIAARFELAGAGIMSVTHHCSLEALADQSHSLDLTRLEAAIMREYAKEGKIV